MSNTVYAKLAVRFFAKDETASNKESVMGRSVFMIAVLPVKNTKISGDHLDGYRQLTAA